MVLLRGDQYKTTFSMPERAHNPIYGSEESRLERAGTITF